MILCLLAHNAANRLRAFYQILTKIMTGHRHWPLMMLSWRFEQ